MIEINLFPPQKIKEREEKKYFGKIIASFLLLFIILITSSYLLFIFKDTLNLYINSQKKELEVLNSYLNQEKNKRIQEKIENINKILSRLAIVEKNKTSLFEPILELIKITPPNISFVSLTISEEDKKIEIAGIAKKREDLLEFQNNLKKSEYFQNISSPISNFVSQTNINFSLEATFTKK